MEVGLNNARDAIVSDQYIRLIRLRPKFVQQIVDTLCNLKHGFAGTVAAGKVLLRLVELPPVARRGLKAAEILLDKALLGPRGDACDL